MRKRLAGKLFPVVVLGIVLTNRLYIGRHHGGIVSRSRRSAHLPVRSCGADRYRCMTESPVLGGLIDLGRDWCLWDGSYLDMDSVDPDAR